MSARVARALPGGEKAGKQFKLTEGDERRFAVAILSERVRALELRPAPVGGRAVGRHLGGGPGRWASSNIITRGGSLWLAERDHPGKPGDGESGWRLVVKFHYSRPGRA